MRTMFLCLAVLLVVPPAEAAPAPDPSRKAKEKLGALKKRLPDIVKAWAKVRWYLNEAAEKRPSKSGRRRPEQRNLSAGQHGTPGSIY